MRFARTSEIVLAVLAAGLGVTARAAAQAPAASPGAVPGAPAPPSCVPPCRDGYTCASGRCLSLCNPPCPANQVCVDGRRCEPPVPGGAGAPVYEPPPPRVRSFEERSHAMIGFHYGFSGSVERDEVEADLASTYGVNLRSDIPIERYLLIGPLLQFGAWRPDVSPEPDRSYYADLDLFVRARLPIATSSTSFQFWGGVPVGLSVHFLGEEVENVASAGFGWNIGVLFGAAAHFTPRFGLFAELGWLQHRVSHGADEGQDLDFRLAQWNMNLGLVLRN